MTQMLTRIAMTFQSTSENASISVITPIHTIAMTPSSAATVLSTTFAITMTIVTAKIATAIHSIMASAPGYFAASGLMLPMTRTPALPSVRAGATTTASPDCG